MHSLTYMTLLCGASTAVVGSALRYRAPQDVQVGNVLDDEVIGDIVGDAVDGMIDGAKTIISKIPLEEFGHLPAVTLEEAIADPSIIEEVLHNGTAGEVQTRDLMYERQSMLTNSSSSSSSTPFLNGTFTNVTITNTNTTTFTNTTTINTTNTTNTTTIETEATCDASTVSTRIEWRDYAPEDRKALVDSIACLLTTPSGGAQYAPSTNRYEDFVRTHQALVSVIHGNGLFLLWHRYFLAAFETALRTSCGFDRPLPWWDETLDNGAFNLSSLFTADYFGSLKGPVHGAGVCVTDGRFANLTCNIGPGQQNEAHCLSRAVNETLTVQASESFVEYCAVRTKFGDFSSCAETGPHAWAHNGIGSIMAEVSASPSDPIFFMHHLFVDHQFASWQEANSTRKTFVDGACEDGKSPCKALTLDSVVDMNGLLPSVTVGELLNTENGSLCYTYDRF